MKKLIVVSVSGLAVLVSCGDPAEQITTKIKEERIPVEITEGDLFKGNKILAYLDNETKFLKEANELFLQGLDAYRNQSDLDSANYYLRQSILKEPTPRAYFELGNVSLDKKDYNTALKAYGVAEQLDYQPVSKILYNKACLYSLKGEQEMAGQYLEYALQAGYNNVDHINKDTDLEDLRETHYFKKAVEKGLRGMSNADNLFWLQFKKQFTKPDLPLKMESVMDRAELEELKYISYDYEKYIAEMRDEEFSREVSKGFYYYSQPYETDNFVAIVYIVKDEFMGEFAPLTYRMATFTHEGKLIDKKDLGGRETLDDPLKEATIQKNMTIDVVLKEPDYEKDPLDHGYYDNPMIGSKTIGKKKYKVESNGKIVELKSKTNDMAQR